MAFSSDRGHRNRAGRAAVASAVGLMALLHMVVLSLPSAAKVEPSTASSAHYVVTERVSVGPNGIQANGPTTSARISGDGRSVLVDSTASNLVVDDGNGRRDVFVRDLVSQTTTRVSVGIGGEADGDSFRSDVTPDGRNVTFSSDASNLVTDDGNDQQDVFLRDLDTGSTSMVSVGQNQSDATGASTGGAVSSDGRMIGFRSAADNLVDGDTNERADAFVLDRQTGTTTRVSVASNTDEANASSGGARPSPDGMLATFTSDASNLVEDDTNGSPDVFLHDLEAHTTERVNLDHNSQQGQFFANGGQLSTDNRFMLFSASWPMTADDTNNQFDVFRRDLQTGTNLRATVASDGSQVVGDLGGNGFAMSQNARYITFSSEAATLVPGDTNGFRDVFVRDIDSGTTARVEPAGGAANASMLAPTISDDGNVVAFYSAATNLVPGDTNGFRDVFIARRVTAGPAITSSLTANQTRVAVGQPIDHHLTITNTGDTTLTGITVTASDTPDCEQPVGDLTPAASHTVNCTYIPTADDIGTFTHAATIDTDQTDPIDTNTISVAVRPSRQPDLEIKKAGGTYTGGDTYNEDASGQTATASRPAGSRATFFLRLTNDGSASSPYQVVPAEPLPRGTRIYLGRTTTEVTTAITGRTFTTPRLAAGATLTLRIETTAASTGSRSTLLRAKTTAPHVPQRDTAAAAVTTR